MRIWLVNHYAYAPTDGASTRHWSLAKELIAMGHDVTVIASDFYHKGRVSRADPTRAKLRQEAVEGIPFVWVRTPPYEGNGLRRLWNMVVFAVRVARLDGKDPWPGGTAPTVVIGSSPDLFAALAAWRTASRYKAAFVMEVRDLWPETLITLGQMSRRHPVVMLFAAIEKHLYRRADQIVSLLPDATSHLVENGARMEAITWVPNGVDQDMIPPATPPPAHDEFVVVYAGAHGLANGLDSLLDAAHLVKEADTSVPIRIRLIGDGPERERLRRRAVDEGLENVEFMDAVPKREIYEQLAAADACVIPLRDSALYTAGYSQNKLWDYMASSRPVIASGGGGYSPVASARAGIEVAPGRAHELAEAMRALSITSSTELKAMGRRGRAYVLENHNLRHLAERYEVVLTTATMAHGRNDLTS